MSAFTKLNPFFGLLVDTALCEIRDTQRVNENRTRRKGELFNNVGCIDLHTIYPRATANLGPTVRGILFKWQSYTQSTHKKNPHSAQEERVAPFYKWAQKKRSVSLRHSGDYKMQIQTPDPKPNRGDTHAKCKSHFNKRAPSATSSASPSHFIFGAGKVVCVSLITIHFELAVKMREREKEANISSEYNTQIINVRKMVATQRVAFDGGWILCETCLHAAKIISMIMIVNT